MSYTGGYDPFRDRMMGQRESFMMPDGKPAFDIRVIDEDNSHIELEILDRRSGGRVRMYHVLNPRYHVNFGSPNMASSHDTMSSAVIPTQNLSLLLL